MTHASVLSSALVAVAAATTALSPPAVTAQLVARAIGAPESVEARLVSPRWLAQEPPRLATGSFVKRFFRVVDGETTEVATHHEMLRRLQGPRDTLYMRVQERETPQGLQSDTLLFRASDLMPEPELLDGFDEANLDLVCIALAQRGEGDYLLPTVSRPSGERVTYRVRVGGVEEIDTPAGPVPATRVDYAHPSGHRATLWVDSLSGTVVLEGAQLGGGAHLYAVTLPGGR